MSSLCSLDPRKSFGVADELESFFHVLLHEALMSSNHNLSPDRTQAFVRDYFHRHSSWSGGAFCSAEKEYAIKCATLRYGAINIMFGGHIQHPMNRLLHELLPLFQARMKIHTWEVNDMARRMPPAKVSLPSPSPSPFPSQDLITPSAKRPCPLFLIPPFPPGAPYRHSRRAPLSPLRT